MSSTLNDETVTYLNSSLDLTLLFMRYKYLYTLDMLNIFLCHVPACKKK